MKDSSQNTLEDGGHQPIAEIFENSEGKEVDFLRLTEGSWRASTDYMTTNLRHQWERNINNFYSRHSPGSKYKTEAFRYRSRLFRPKTRASVRAKEAALSIAFFSTSDVVSIEATDQSNPENIASAKVIHEIVNYRLSHTIKWFVIAIAAFQDANVIGSVISHQYWDYEEAISKVRKTRTAYNREIGNLAEEEFEEDEVEVIKDEPVIELVESENFRFDPGADWMDPINSSPYLIQMIPMYVVDVLDRMERVDPKTGQPEWKKLSMSEILKARASNVSEYDSTRQAREQSRQDPTNSYTGGVEEYQIVWVFRNIFRIQGKGDMIWYTLGIHAMLSDPVPLKEVYLHGKRPYAMGFAVIEAHKNYPSGTGELGQDSQAGANDLMNQRFDNVKQVLNKRSYVRRGSAVDMIALKRNVPGSIIMVGDVEKDVKEKETPDITSSSFQEQNLFNADFDEITGNFSAGSVQTNRQLGETVGGMKMMKDPSNTMTEYTIRTYTETWVKEVIAQLVALEQAYETDDVVIAAAGRAAKVDEVPSDIMDVPVTVTANIGFGATDPQTRVGKVLYGLESIAKVAPAKLANLKSDAIIEEIFGILGYQDGSRFFMNEEEIAEYQQKNPQQPDADMLKIQSQEKIEAAKLELDRLVWEARITSEERMKAAELSVNSGKEGAKVELELGKRDIDIEKLNLEKFGLDIKREDMLRKDAEIKDKEKENLNRSGGSA